MKRKVRFGDWDRAVLQDAAKRYPGRKVRLIDGRTLEAYAGITPHESTGEAVEILDCFEARHLREHHPVIAQQCIEGSLND